MSLYVRLETSFWTHRKTIRLKSKLGSDALWIPPRLWCYAAENQPDGCFKDYSPDEIAMLVGYTGDAQVMLQALLQAGFLDSEPLRIHEWAEHNGYHESYAARASKAAQVRWAMERKRQERKLKGKDRRGKEASIASSNAQASSVVLKYSSDDTYKGLDVATEWGKMVNWCGTHGKQPTERRFVNWLNRAERPINGQIPGAGQHRINPVERKKNIQSLLDRIPDYNLRSKDDHARYRELHAELLKVTQEIAGV